MHELGASLRDGTTHFVFEPLLFIERLATLVPLPRLYHLGHRRVLAPAGSGRRDPVPMRETRRGFTCCRGAALQLHRYSFAELTRCVILTEVLKSATCGSDCRWTASIPSG